MREGGKGGDGAVEAGQDADLAEDFEEMIQAGADAPAGAGDAAGLDQRAGLHAEIRRELFERGFQRGGGEFREGRVAFTEFFEERSGGGNESFRPGVGVEVEGVVREEIEVHPSR